MLQSHFYWVPIRGFFSTFNCLWLFCFHNIEKIKKVRRRGEKWKGGLWREVGGEKIRERRQKLLIVIQIFL